MKRYVGLLSLLFAVSLLTSCGKPEQPAGSQELGPAKSDIMPKSDVFYTMVMPPMLYETHQPGPKEQKSSQAWSVANEFVFRTALRTKVVLPASGVTPGKTGYLVRFDGKNESADLNVFVRGDLKAAEWVKD